MSTQNPELTHDVGGRPPKFETPEQMEKAVDEYLANTPVPQITITGLCMWLGFVSKQSLYDYEKREGFSYPVLKARLAVENSYETTLRTVAAPGSVFALKNMGWKDSQDHNFKGDLSLGAISINIIKPGSGPDLELK